MRPVDQTMFGAKEGNCWAACVASLLEIPIEDVPHFCRDFGAADWFPAFLDWIKERGFFAVDMNPMNDNTWDWIRRFAPDVHWIAGGQSSRAPHAVLYLGDKMVHDPHPSREGLTLVEDATFIFPRLIQSQGTAAAKGAGR